MDFSVEVIILVIKINVPRLKKYYFRILTLFVVLSITLTVGLSLVMYNIYTVNTMKQIDSVSVQMLNKSSYFCESIMGIARTFAMQTYFDTDMSIYMNSKERDSQLQQSIMISLTSKRNSYPFIHSVYVYNKNFKTMIGTDYSPISLQEVGNEKIMDVLKGESESGYMVIPRKISPLQDRQVNNILSILMSERNARDEAGRNAILVNMNASAFLEQQNTASIAHGNKMFIMDGQGIILAHTDEKEFMKDYSQWDYIRHIMNSSGGSGSLRDRVDGNEYLVSYVTNPSLKWTIVNLIPIASVLETPAKVQQQIIILCSIILVSGLLLSSLFSRTIYKPVGKIVTQISKEDSSEEYKNNLNEMEYISKIYNEVVNRARVLYHQHQSNLSFLRDEFLRNSLVYETEDKDMEEQFGKYEIELAPKDLLVVVLRTAEYDSVEENLKPIYKIGISNGIHERLEGDFNHLTLPMWKGEFVVLINFDPTGEHSLEALLGKFKEIQEYVKETFGVLLTISIGEPVEEAKDMRSSYLHALRLMKYRVMHGPETILHNKHIEDRVNEDFQYPEEIEKAIVAALKTGKRNAFENEVNEWLNLAAGYRYEQFSYVFMQISLSCIKHIASINGNQKPEWLSNYNHVAQRFEEMESLQEVQKWFLELFDQYRLAVEAIQENKSEKNVELVRQAENYIRQNFHNPDLNVDALAEKFNFSPNYFGKLFKEINNINVSDFISELRFEKAKELLKETELNVNEVAVRSGFNNINYFYYAFRKNVGLTPASYRVGSRDSSK